MCGCMICKRIERIRKGENPWFVRELNTGYVVIGDHQRIPGYSLFLCRECKQDLHQLEPAFRDAFLREMAITAEAVSKAFGAEKMNYMLLGAGQNLHMHWHLYPRRAGDTPRPGPVFQLGDELLDDRFLPTETELETLKRKLNDELDKLL